MDAAKSELGKPFPQEVELVQKSAHLAELDAKLNMSEEHGEPEHDERVIAKSARPSVLDNLKMPSQPGHSGKRQKIEREVR